MNDMPMTALVVARFLWLLIAYTGVTVGLPAVMFRKILKGRRLAEQFLMCYTFGNFYMINIVFVLQLLHISNFFTLTTMTIVLSLLIWKWVNRVSLKQRAITIANAIQRFLRGSMGARLLLSNIKEFCFHGLKHFMKIFYEKVIKHPIRFWLLMMVLGMLFWIYGRQIVLAYGYRASDIPVHMSWINEMSRGNLFSNGVYPFGYHCTIYYLHAMFRMDTYAILCEFFLVQIIYAHLVPLAMLKLLCKTNYMPYASMSVYILGNFWAIQTYSRYSSTLPQEFGMIFIVPSIYFLIRFFQTKKEDLEKKETTWYLQCFAMAFGLTLAIHFYGTMIAGLCCVGIGLGFFFRFFRKEYFFRIMKTGILSVIIAVLPMVIAFVGGTPLQGSLGWGMSVINGGSNKEDEEEIQEEQPEVTTEANSDAQSSGEKQTVTITNSDGSTQEVDVSDLPSAGGDGSPTEVVEEPKISMQERMKNAVVSMKDRIKEFIISLDEKYEKYEDLICYLILASFVVLIGMGSLLCILKQTAYGGMLLSMGLCMVIMTFLLCAGIFGLIQLMDPARCSIYYTYLLSQTIFIMVDGALYLAMPLKKLHILRNGVSFVIVLTLVVGLLQKDMIKHLSFEPSFVRNESIVCMSNIIHDNEDKTWTIVSANDETQMGLDHGWHYEINNFLKEMDYLEKDTKITIPTQFVYFFIEKIPLDYAIPYENSGQSISTKGASRTLPNIGVIGTYEGIYQGEYRWVTMSKMYEWAKAFKEQYPNDLKVYYETDQFICYKVEQNMYHQYNFAIDYGYNQKMTKEKAKGAKSKS